MGPDQPGRAATELLEEGVGRRTLLRAAAAMSSAGAAGLALPADRATASLGRDRHDAVRVLQPGSGPIRGTYLATSPATVSWGKLPNRDTEPVAVVSSGAVVTVDTLSHEGVLEDQGRDPRDYFGGFGVRSSDVLRDAVEVAARAAHDGPGPHVATASCVAGCRACGAAFRCPRSWG